MTTQIYTAQFLQAMEKLSESRVIFLKSFGGALQVLDGIVEAKTAMTLKVRNDLGGLEEYKTDADITKESRFGKVTEALYENVDVPFEAVLSKDILLDEVTINGDLEAAVADVMDYLYDLQADATNKVLIDKLSKAGEETVKLTADPSKAELTDAFAKAREALVNAKLRSTTEKVAYVSPEVYSKLVSLDLLTTAKHSTADIDNGTVDKFFGFTIEEVPAEYFEKGTNAIFTAVNVGVAGYGISHFRVVEAENAAGYRVQYAGKEAAIVPDVNKKYIVKGQTTVTANPQG